MKNTKINKWENLFDEFLDLIEFKLVKYPNNYNKDSDEYGYWGLIDIQGGNIGNIEGDRFNNAKEIFDRMYIYIDDYIINSIIEHAQELNIPISFEDSSEQILKYRNEFPKDNQWDLDILDMICNHSENINLKNCMYKEVNEI